MKRTLVNSLHPDDYAEIYEGVEAVKRAATYLTQRGAHIIVPPTDSAGTFSHRLWEYGTCVQMLLDQYQERMPDITVLDVGSGYGALGPTLALFYSTAVTECEPGEPERVARLTCNKVLVECRKRPIKVLPNDTDHLPNEQFDAVFCVSVAEHMPTDVEARCWKNLVDRVKPGGVFFADVDCVPAAGHEYKFDNMRIHNFTIPEIKERVELLRSYGMTPMGRPDYTWNGAHVFDYTFFRMGMMKVQESC